MEPVGELPPQAKPSEEFEEIIDVPSELDKLNQRLSIQQKISLSLADQFPLRIIYTTLKGHTTERTVEPDYVHQAMTGNQILVAWDHLSFTTPFGTAPSRGDWRGFILNRIRGAKLEDKGEAVPA
jgi:predicted DNA-binding transcriptional regulator YafY